MKTVLSERGQIVIPKKIRDAIQVDRGDEFEIEVVEGKLLLMPVKRFKAKTWRDYDGVADGIVNLHLREKKRDKQKEDVYP